MVTVVTIYIKAFNPETRCIKVRFIHPGYLLKAALDHSINTRAILMLIQSHMVEGLGREWGVVVACGRAGTISWGEEEVGANLAFPYKLGDVKFG